MLKKKKGIALITVLMILLVLSILGTTLLTISVNETKLSVNNEKKMQAYYIARSGADAVASWLESHGNEASSIIPASGNYTSEEVGLGDGTFKVRILRETNDPSLIRIESTSTLNNSKINGKAVLIMKEMGGLTGNEIYTETIFAKKISITGNTNIIGDMESINNIIIKGNKSISGNITEGSKKSFPEPVFPELPKEAYDSNGISKDGEYSIPHNSNLIFNTAKNQILKIVVDSLDIKDITINGDGSVFLFLNTSVKISGNININGNNKKNSGNSDPNSLFIFGKEGNYIEFTGKSDVNGFIYAPNSIFTMRGNADITGAIIAGEAAFRGNTDLIYEKPEATIANNVVTFLGTSYKRENWSSN